MLSEKHAHRVCFLVGGHIQVIVDQHLTYLRHYLLWDTMGQNGSELGQIGSNWVTLGQNGSNWVKIGQNWVKLRQNGSKWVKLGQSKVTIGSPWL
jgi:hypothetical protein